MVAERNSIPSISGSTFADETPHRQTNRFGPHHRFGSLIQGASSTMPPAALSKEEAVQRALARHGDLPAADLAKRIAQDFGISIDPRFLPIFKASIRYREEYERFGSQTRMPRTQLPESPRT
jgi:hypothetical protein